jgi:hypothetical protein
MPSGIPQVPHSNRAFRHRSAEFDFFRSLLEEYVAQFILA